MNNATNIANAWSGEPKPRRSSYLWLGRRLRQLLNAYEEGPVPDRFKHLLDRLEQSEAEPKADSSVTPANSVKPQP